MLDTCLLVARAVLGEKSWLRFMKVGNQWLEHLRIATFSPKCM